MPFIGEQAIPLPPSVGNTQSQLLVIYSASDRIVIIRVTDKG